VIAEHRFAPAARVALHLLRGRSLLRALFTEALRRLDLGLAGRTLDLGAKSREAAYYRHLRLAPGDEVVFTDLLPGPGVVVLDVERPFPFPDASFDTVLAFHLFEHVYRLDLVASEALRVLRPGGRVVVSVPFLHEYHGDPADYRRFTDQCLERWWVEAGFETAHLSSLAEGLATTAATNLVHALAPRFLRGLLAAAAYAALMPLDRLASLRPRVGGRSLPQRFALEHLAVFRKPGTA
jgi:SAM-dependent methyltransferase